MKAQIQKQQMIKSLKTKMNDLKFNKRNSLEMTKSTNKDKDCRNFLLL